MNPGRIVLNPEEALKRLHIENILRDVQNLSGDAFELLSAEEVLELGKEFLNFASSYFFEVAKDTKSVNPTIIVGETNVSNDKTVAGTVNSRRTYQSRPFPLPQKVADIVKDYFDEKYLELDSFVKNLKKKNYQFFLELNQVHESCRIVPEVKARRANRQTGNVSASYFLRQLAKARKKNATENKNQQTRRNSRKRS